MFSERQRSFGGRGHKQPCPYSPSSAFVDHHPTVKMLALSFLLLIGVTLIADGFGQHISKAYIYFAMGFSTFVEILNIKIRKSASPVKLRQPYADKGATQGKLR